MREQMRIDQCGKFGSNRCPHEEVLKLRRLFKPTGPTEPVQYDFPPQYFEEKEEVNKKYCLNCDQFEPESA